MSQRALTDAQLLEEIRKIQEDESGSEIDEFDNESDDEDFVPTNNDSDSEDSHPDPIRVSVDTASNVASTSQQFTMPSTSRNPRRKRNNNQPTVKTGDTEQSRDGTRWTLIDSGSTAGRFHD